MPHGLRLALPPRKSRQISQRVKSYVNRRIAGNMENKTVFFNVAEAASNNTPVVTDLSSIAQGDTQFARDGDTIAPQNLDVKVLCRSSVAAGAVSGAVRIMVLSTRVEGTPVIADVLQNTSFPEVMISAQLVTPLLSKILFDRHVILDTDTATGSRAKLVRIRLNKKQLPAKIVYNNAATTASKNKLWLITFSQENTLTPVLTVQGRMIFKDL